MANNDYVNKVQYGNDTLIDLTNDTAGANQVMEGYTFHSASGEPSTGSLIAHVLDGNSMTEIQTYTDLDTLIEPGSYISKTSEITSTLTNVPESVTTGFHLEVLSVAGTRGQYITQIIRTNIRMLVRHNIPGSWEEYVLSSALNSSIEAVEEKFYGTVTDLNLVKPGDKNISIKNFASGASNSPVTGGGVCVALGQSNNYFTQIVFTNSSSSNCHVYARTYGSNAFNNWSESYFYKEEQSLTVGANNGVSFTRVNSTGGARFFGHILGSLKNLCDIFVIFIFNGGGLAAFSIMPSSEYTYTIDGSRVLISHPTATNSIQVVVSKDYGANSLIMTENTN